jgi:hypothetical protein
MPWSDDDKRYLQRILDGEKPEDVEAEQNPAPAPAPTPIVAAGIPADALDDAAKAYQSAPTPENYSKLRDAQQAKDASLPSAPAADTPSAPVATTAPPTETDQSWMTSRMPTPPGRQDETPYVPDQTYNPATGHWESTPAFAAEKKNNDAKFEAEQAAKKAAEGPSTVPTGAPVLPGGGAAGAAPAGPAIGRLPLAPVVPTARPTLDIRGLEAARSAQAGAIAGGADTAVANADAEAQARQAAIGDQRIQMAADAASNEDTLRQLAAQRARLAKRADEIAQEHVDPDHYWKSKNSFEQLVAGVGLAIGGGLKGFDPSAGNPAMELMNKSIEQEVDAQKANIEGDRKSLDVDQNLYAQNLALYKDQQTAEAATRADMWKLAEQQIQSVADKAAGDEKRANAQQMLAAADVEHQKWMMDAAQKYRIVSQESEAKRLATAAARAQMAATHPAAHAPTASAPASKVDAEKIALLAPGEDKELIPIGGIGGRQAYILPPNPATAADIRKRMDKGETYEHAAAGSGARVVIMSDSGQLVKTEHGFTGTPTLPAAGAGSTKVSPRLGLKLASAEQANELLKHVDTLERGGWQPFGKGSQAGKDAAAELRDGLREAGVEPSTIDELLPKDYNPSDGHWTGKQEQALKDVKRAIAHQKKVINSAVEMSRGQADTAEDSAP